MTCEDNSHQLVINLSRYRKNRRTKEKIKMKWRIHKRRMKSSKRRDQKFERSSGELNLTDCVDQIKFYLCLSVRKASSISKKVNFKCKLVFIFSKNQPRDLKRKCVFPKINRGIWNLNQRICYLNLFFLFKMQPRQRE